VSGPYTINTAGTASTVYTITWSTASTTTPRKEPEPKPEKVDVLACLRGAPLPEPMPPRLFGTCGGCGVNLAMDACGGRCSVCGGPLRVG
jgi:hypothetical protein